MNLFSRTYLTAVTERAVKTFAQSLAALLAAAGTGLLDTDWGGRVSVAAMAAVVSVLSSIASAGVGDTGPSLAGEGLRDPSAVPAARADLPVTLTAATSRTAMAGSGRAG